MRSVQNIFRAAGIYGLIVTLPQYFRMEANGTHFPPAITHPEYYFGFIGLIVVFQLLFLVIGHDPMHYRSLMPLCMLEKIAYADPASILYYQHKLAFPMFIAGAVDLVWGVLFLWAFYITGRVTISASRKTLVSAAARETRMDRATTLHELGRESVRN